MDTNRNVIKEARASLLLPSRPKTPQVNSYSRKVSLLPLWQLTDKSIWDNILSRLENNQDIDKIWNILAKMTQEDDISEGNLNLILEYLVQGEITTDKHKILKNLTYKIENHKILLKFGIFQILDQELINSHDLFVITDITEIYRNLASNRKNAEYFQQFFYIIQDKSTCITSQEIWFNILRICAKLSFLDVYNDFWISKFFSLLTEFTASKELVTRILFTLGNLCMEIGIHKYFHDYDLIFLIQYYSSIGDEEVLIKIIRLYTNLALDIDLGKKLCRNSQLLDILNYLDSENEELVLNTMAFLANYTYFKEEDNVFLKDLDYIIKVLQGIMTDHEEITTQGIRIICNISNIRAGKSLITQDINLRMILAMMGHPGRDVVYYSCCILLNVSSCTEFVESDLEFLCKIRQEWSQDQEISHLLHLLISF